jgi:hypothetical protein
MTVRLQGENFFVPGMRRSVFEFDDVGVVVDADGVESPQDVLAEQSVKLDSENLTETIKVHDGNTLAGPYVIRQFEIDRQDHTVAGDPRTSGVAFNGAQTERHLAVNVGADDGARGAGIEQERDRTAIYLAFHDDHRLRGAEWDAQNARTGAIGQRREQHKDQQDIAKPTARRRGCSQDAPANGAAAACRGGQNGTRSRGRNTVRAWANCAQINHPLAAAVRPIRLGAQFAADNKPDLLGQPRPPPLFLERAATGAGSPLQRVQRMVGKQQRQMD